MELILNGPVNITELFVTARLAAGAAVAPFSPWLPARQRGVTRWSGRATETTRVAAEARVPDASPLTAPRSRVSKREGTLVPVSLQDFTSEAEAMYQNGAADPQTVEDVYNAGADLAEGVMLRAELFRAQVLQTGLVVVRENGFDEVVSFGADSVSTPDQFPTAAVAWSDQTNSTPLSDLIAWHSFYIERAETAATVFALDQQAYAWLLTSDEVRNYASSGGTVPLTVSAAQLELVLDSYGLPRPLVIPDRINFQDVSVPEIIPGQVTFLPAGEMGEVTMGRSEYLDGLTDAGVQVEQIGGVVASYFREVSPPQKFIVVDGPMFPVVAKPNQLFSATVI